MPGFPVLPASVQGLGTERIRAHGPHDDVRSLTLLEAVMWEIRDSDEPLPGWLCGRLAACYRTAGRFNDEVALLEEYCDRQIEEADRGRYHARLCKARILADRHNDGRELSGALASIRRVTEARSVHAVRR